MREHYGLKLHDKDDFLGLIGKITPHGEFLNKDIFRENFNSLKLIASLTIRGKMK